MSLLKYNLIGLHGKMRAGKDTFAVILNSILTGRSLNPYVEVSFAEPIKEAMKIICDWDNTDVYDPVKKELVDPRWGFTPRFAMQQLGTEFGREILGEDFWVRRAATTISKWHKASRDVIVTDVRFENEATMIEENGGIIIHIINPHDTAPIKHASESGIELKPQHLVVINDKTLGLEGFASRIEELVDGTG